MKRAVYFPTRTMRVKEVVACFLGETVGRAYPLEMDAGLMQPMERGSIPGCEPDSALPPHLGEYACCRAGVPELIAALFYSRLPGVWPAGNGRQDLSPTL